MYRRRGPILCPATGLELAKRLYEELAEKGHADEGTHALFRLFDPEAKA
ncbi:MAG: hypothetical protein ACLFR7_05540 [Opitutales bacterium]